MQETWGRSPGSQRSPGEENSNPFQYSCLGNLAGCSARDHSPHQKPGGLQCTGSQSTPEAWRAAVHGITESATTEHTRAQDGFPALDSSYILSRLSHCSSFTWSPILHTNLSESCDSIFKNPLGSPLPACIHAKPLQSCPTLYDPMDCSPPGSPVHGILQASIREWVAMPSSRGSSGPRDQTCVSCIVR